MIKKIQWLKWEDPLTPNKDDIDLETKSHKDSFKEFDDSEERHVRLVVGPYGLLPLNENAVTAKLYKLWVGHCNFEITDTVKEKIESVAGVEVLRIWTRYRFWLGVANLFDDSDVQSNIEKLLTEEKELKNKNIALKALIKVLKNKYKFWAVLLEKSGELKTIGSENIEDVKKETELNKNLNILACSWKND